jgi:hypothetical protein
MGREFGSLYNPQAADQYVVTLRQAVPESTMKRLGSSKAKSIITFGQKT